MFKWQLSKTGAAVESYRMGWANQCGAIKDNGRHLCKRAINVAVKPLTLHDGRTHDVQQYNIVARAEQLLCIDRTSEI
jgi:hypothetical protein